MLNFLVIAAGAAIGAYLRYLVSLWAVRAFGPPFPFGTLIVNVAGCFLIGVVLVLAATRWPISAEWRLFLVTGLLGSLTTFSTFGYETFALLENGELRAALLNLVASVVLGLAAVVLGAALARAWPS